MNKKLLITIVGIIVLIIGGFIFLKIRRSGIQVQKIQPESRIVNQSVSASGLVKSKHSSDLGFALGGRIVSLKVKKGDHVNSGDVLAQVYSSPQSKTADSYEWAVRVAEKDRDLYVETYSGDDNIEFRQSDEYKLTLNQYNEKIDKAKSTYQSSLSTIANSYIKAPFDGTIIDTLKSQGEVTTAAETIIKIADLDNLYFEVELDQEDFGKVHPKAQAQIELDSYEGNMLNGEVIELPQYADEDGANKQFTVDISIDNDAYQVLLGMTGTADIITNQTSAEVTTLPFDVIYQNDNGDDYVWILLDQKLKKQPIETGIEGDLYTEVKTDISNYEVVVPIKNGISKVKLTEGQKARVKN